MSEKSNNAMRLGLLLSAGALFAVLTAAPATAAFSQNQDNSQLMSRIDQLENQIQTLSRSVYKGGPAPVVSYDNGSGGNASAYEDRISQLEQQQRQLTGKIEQLTYDVQQMQERLNRSSADNYTQAPAAANNSRYSNNYPYAQPQQQASVDDGNNGIYGAQMSNSDRSPPPRTLGVLSSRGPGSADSLYEDAFSDISGQKYDSAASKFQRFMSQFPTHPLASNAQYWLAETYYVRAEYKESAKLFAQGYQDYPQGTKAAASLLKLGMSLSRLGKKEDACLSFVQLKKEFPGGQTPEIRAADSEMRNLSCAG
ncbi:MAG: tol-pal system protein YbgF [Alphaproteobacteria bacterium]